MPSQGLPGQPQIAQHQQGIFQPQVSGIPQLSALQHAQVAAASMNPLLNQGMCYLYREN